MHTGNGAASSAVIYFEHEPGEHHGRHTDSAEEVVLVLDGEAQVIAGDEGMRLGAGALALVPAMVPHDISNVGPGRLRVVGFFSSAAPGTSWWATRASEEGASLTRHACRS
jgi:quercetin dioxygenase-like cupin family protein